MLSSPVHPLPNSGGPGGRIVSRVLLTNDDGIDAPGLAVLEQVAASLADEVWVVAPEHDQSGTSHSISLHQPLRYSRHGERRFGISGTPGDCVVMAVRHLMLETPPSLVLAGVNRGGNLGVETVFPGTVGAPMAGMRPGRPSRALLPGVPDPRVGAWGAVRLGPHREINGRHLAGGGSAPEEEPGAGFAAEAVGDAVGRADDGYDRLCGHLYLSIFDVHYCTMK